MNPIEKQVLGMVDVNGDMGDPQDLLKETTSFEGSRDASHVWRDEKCV